MTRMLSIMLIAVMFSMSCSPRSTPTPLVVDQSIIDIQALESRTGLVFVPTDSSDASLAKLTEEEAIVKAQEAVTPINGAANITAELGYLGSPQLETAAANGEKVDSALLAHPLVWIISYRGVEIPVSPPGREPFVAHEYNVVIDANTGAYITGFIYR